jgi:hypothetical protein
MAKLGRHVGTAANEDLSGGVKKHRTYVEAVRQGFSHAGLLRGAAKEVLLFRKKKKQKDCCSSGSELAAAAEPTDKSFLLLFFKKEGLFLT